MSIDPQRLKRVFLGAVEIADRAERQAWIVQECGSDQELLAKAQALLKARDDPDSFLDRMAPVPAAPPESTGAEQPEPAPETPRPAPAPGQHIGPYRLLQNLGEGGFGIVYLAEQQRPVQRKVAVKVLKPGLDSAAVLARFEAERQALALMDHPNIARVFDAGLTDDQRPYFVMELIKGIPITKYCDQERLSPRERLDLFVPVCNAVQHAHQKGIIHRDLKPSNVLIALYDGKPVPKVIDFGVAKATGQKLTERTMFTEVGQIIGTLEYMAPEQAELNNLDIDTRADIYSLGVMLYELLTGSPPFTAKQLRGAAFSEMLRLIREAEPPKPSTRVSTAKDLPNLAAARKLEPKKLATLMRGDLDWIVMKCLEKERGRRYETANGLALEIQRYLADEPVLAGPPSMGYRLRKFVRRNRGPVLAAAVVLAALLAGIAGTTLGLIRAQHEQKLAETAAEAARQARRDAEAKQAEAQALQARAEAGEKLAGERLVQVEAEKRRAEDERQIAEAVRDFLRNKLLGQASVWMQADTLLGHGGLAAQANRNVTVRELLDRAAAGLTPEKIEANFPKQPLLQAEVLEVVGNTYRGVGEYGLAVSFLQRAAGMRQQLDPDHPETERALNNLAVAYEDAGKVSEAITLLQRLRTAQEKKGNPGDPRQLATLNNLALAYRTAGRLAEATDLLKQVVVAREKELGPDHLDTLLALDNLASIHLHAGNPVEAIKILEQVRAARETSQGADHPDALITRNFLGAAYRDAGRVPEAINLLQQVRADAEKRLGPDHPQTQVILGDLAMAYRAANRLPEAIALLRKLRDLREIKLGPDHPSTLRTLNDLAAAYWSAGQLDKSIPLSEEALKRREAKLGRDHPATLLTVANVGVNYKDAGRVGEAIPLLEEAYRKGQGDAGLAWVGRQLLDAYVQARRSAEVSRLIPELLADSRKRFPAGSPQLGSVLEQVGLALAEFKKWDEAEPLLRESLAIREKAQPGALMTAFAKSLLGSTLLAQKKYAEAEPLLLAGYEGMKKQQAAATAQGKAPLAEAVERLVQLYEATGKKDQAARWREELQTIRAANGPAGPKP